MKLKIASTIGKNCITTDDGERIYRIIHPELIKGHDVTLDFSGVEIFASPFFNAAIGQLLSDIKIRKLELHLQTTGLTQHGTHVLNRVIENAHNYFTNPHFRESVEKVLAQQSIDL